MRIPTLPTWFAKKPSAASASKDRTAVRIGIPRVLNIWSTHQFWVAFLRDLGIAPENIVFSSDSSEEQLREFGKGRGTVDCCYPVKTISGHYGELVFGLKKKIHILLSPMIYSIPSFLHGHVVDSLTCTRVMAGPEVVAGQLYESLKDVLDLGPEETERAVKAGFQALRSFNQKMRDQGRNILSWCAREGRPCILVLGRPYHMDPGIGHEIEADLQAQGYPILWLQYFPIHEDLLDWMFGEEIRAGRIKSAFDISDVWSSSYSGNTNEILWGAKVAARCPWITCALRLSSYECGMDQPTYTPTQKIVEATGT